MTRYAAIAVLFHLICSLTSNAQKSESFGPLDFSFVTWGKLAMPHVFYRDGSSYHEIEFRSRARSRVYKFKEDQNQMLLYTQLENPDGELVYTLLGKCDIKAGSSKMLFFVQERADKKEGELPLIVSGIDDSLEAFPMGSFRFVNNTKIPVQVLFPTSRGQVPAKSTKVLVPEIPKLGGFIPLFILDMNKNILFQSRFFGQPRGRKMVFINPPAREGGRVRLLFLPHIVPTMREVED